MTRYEILMELLQKHLKRSRELVLNDWDMVNTEHELVKAADVLSKMLHLVTEESRR
jgi:hypothetical protein